MDLWPLKNAYHTTKTSSFENQFADFLALLESVLNSALTQNPRFAELMPDAWRH